MSSPADNKPCPCDSGQSYEQCCKPFLLGRQLADRAELLMRSRYTAYVLHDEAYLLATWHASTRPASLHLDRQPIAKWLGLTIKRSLDLDPRYAQVEFVARYKINGRGYRMHEISRFERVGGQWFYLDGVVS